MFEDPKFPTAADDADAAYEAMRSICHSSGPFPAPVVYVMLGNLKHVGGDMFAQAMSQLGQGLEKSLTEYKVFEDDGTDPAKSVTVANAHLLKAAALAVQLGTELDAAQQAIAKQGYKE